MQLVLPVSPNVVSSADDDDQSSYNFKNAAVSLHACQV